MALDGIVIANIRQELEQTLLGGRLYKIAQPETDELLFTIKTPKQQYRLVISANASLPQTSFSSPAKAQTDSTALPCRRALPCRFYI